jgi:hypothetical protein
MPQMRVYNALNGDELRKILVAELDQALSMDSNFRQHKTYHMPSWEWHFTAHAVPESRGPIEAKVSGAVVLIDETTKQPVPYDDDDLLVIEHSNTAKPSSQPDRGTRGRQSSRAHPDPGTARRQGGCSHQPRPGGKDAACIAAQGFQWQPR